MDVLCTDETGTLTQDKVVLEKHLNLTGRSDLRVLELASLNSYYQTGLKNLLDRAVFEHVELAHEFDVLQHLPVLLLTTAVMAVGIYLPFSRLGGATGMAHLPWTYFPWLAVTLLAYCALTQGVKTWYIRRFHAWL